MIEVELKAEIDDIEKMASTLKQKWIPFSPFEKVVYIDHYFDNNEVLLKAEKELRIREINYPDSDKNQVQLTFKDSPVDQESKSKEETELFISDVQEGLKLMEKLGYTQFLCFKKECLRSRYRHGEFLLSVTLAYLPELKRAFIEIETQTDNPEAVEKIKKILTDKLRELGIEKDQITNQYYTDALLQSRCE